MDAKEEQAELRPLDATGLKRSALLALQLRWSGVDTRHLEFLRWLIEQGRDPEWFGDEGVLRLQTTDY